MVYIIGDTHIPNDFRKLEKINDPRIQYVIVTGDFGLIWEREGNELETYYKDILNKKSFTTLFVRGNHENHSRLQKLPKVDMFGARVAKISDKIFQLLDGRIYTIEGNTFFTLGGAESTDKIYRVPYVTWWPEEIPSHLVYKQSLNILESHNNKVDYIISHTAPTTIIKEILQENPLRFNDYTAEMLEEIKNRVSFKKWFFGHFHEDLEIDNFICTMEKGHLI